MLGQGPDNRTCVRLRHAGCPAQGPPDTLLMMTMTMVMMMVTVMVVQLKVPRIHQQRSKQLGGGWGGMVMEIRCVGCVGTTEKTLSAPAKNTHLLILTSHKTAAFTINNKASVLFYSSGKNRGGIA